jgi:hypothetical protein
MTTSESPHSALDGARGRQFGDPDFAERELRAKARTLRALAQSALATGTADGSVREYLNAVMAFAGMYAGGDQ